MVILIYLILGNPQSVMLFAIVSLERKQKNHKVETML